MSGSTQAAMSNGELFRGGDYFRHVRGIFVGVRPKQHQGNVLQGSAVVSAFGPGRIASMCGSPMLLQRKTVANDATSASFNLLINVQGNMEMEHGTQLSELTAGDAVLLDGARPFAANIRSEYRQLLVQFPRHSVARRYPQLVRRAGSRLPSEHPAIQLLAQTSHLLVTRTPSSFDSITQPYAYDAMLALLGALSSGGIAQHSIADHRFARALADVDANLSDTHLSAGTLANLQGISRRRLDAIFVARGLTVEQVIWTRRLERAASEIGRSDKGTRKLLEIATAHGFSSEAHFSRRFRAHFGLSPREYRNADR